MISSQFLKGRSFFQKNLFTPVVLRNHDQLVRIPLLCSFLLLQFFTEWAEASQITLRESDQGTRVFVSQGDLLQVQLHSNRTTGYSWNLQIMGDKILHQEKLGYQPSDKSGTLIGSGETEIWKFRAQQAGSTRLDFFYARPWEKGVPPVRMLHYPVTVKP